ncbi:MAG: TraB/VirB10 family protein [Burkholderiales bacterium]|nr:TraB/VirB10 family protein [Burkholderiales bacterium]
MDQQKFHTKTIIKKFRKHLIIGGGIFVIIILVLTYSVSPKEVPQTPKDTVDTTFSAAKNQIPGIAEVMQQHLTSFEANQQKINQQNTEKIAQLESENQSYKQAAQEAESNASKINEKLAQINNVKISESSVANKQQYKPVKLVLEDDINDTQFSNVSASDVVSSGMKSNESGTGADIPNKKDTTQDVATYIPSNSFTKGVLIGSLSANTGGNANADPTPVLIRLTDLAQLPNSFRSNIKSCMVGGSGFGDLSTERVKIRLTTLSCVLKSGKAIDIPVKGYIAGEDAKAGIKGMVVTHSGAIAAKAAMAGFLQGLGTVGQAMGQTQTITPLGGVTTTIAPDQAAYAGGGAGLSQVGSTLSQYYLGMLQQISPAIEVSAGRHITVIFTQGVELKLPINKDVELSGQELPLNQGE